MSYYKNNISQLLHHCKWELLKAGYVIFKNVELSRGGVPKQACSQSAVSVYSWYWGESVQWTAEPSDRKIWQIKNKRGKCLRKDKERRTHVNVGSAFQRFPTQGAESLRWDAEVALYLPDRWVTLCLHRTATANACLHWTCVFQARM